MAIFCRIAVALYGRAEELPYRFAVGIYGRKVSYRVVVGFYGRKPAYQFGDWFLRFAGSIYGRKPAYQFVDWSLHRHEFAECQGASTSSSHRQGATTSPSGRRAHTCWRRAKGHPRVCRVLHRAPERPTDLWSVCRSVARSVPSLHPSAWSLGPRLVGCLQRGGHTGIDGSLLPAWSRRPRLVGKQGPERGAAKFSKYAGLGGCLDRASAHMQSPGWRSRDCRREASRPRD